MLFAILTGLRSYKRYGRTKASLSGTGQEPMRTITPIFILLSNICLVIVLQRYNSLYIYLLLGTFENGEMLKFHHAHGRNIQLSEKRNTARRTQSFANALVFSHRPLELNEIFLLEIEDHENGWAGHIRMGITLHNPTSIAIPQYLLPDLYQLGKSYVFTIKNSIDDPFNDHGSGTQVENVKCKKTEKYIESIKKCQGVNFCDHIDKNVLTKSISCKPCDIESRVGLLISPSRELYFIINGVQFGPCAKNIPTSVNVYVAVDLYGMTKQVRLINCTSKCCILYIFKCIKLTRFLSLFCSYIV